MEWIFGIVGLAFGVALGLVITANLARSVATEDMDRLTSLELFGWTTAHTNSRWAVLRQVNGEMKVIGTTHSSLRQAIDVAVEVERKG